MTNHYDFCILLWSHTKFYFCQENPRGPVAAAGGGMGVITPPPLLSRHGLHISSKKGVKKH